MAVELLALPSPIDEGEMELVGIRYQSSFLGSDVIQSGELDRIFKTVLLKMSPFPQIPVRKNSMTREVVLECPDGGHRCPYFPCPTCHRTRSMSGPKTSSNWKSENEVSLHQEISNADTDEDPFIINSDDSSDNFFFVPALECGDGGHRCPYFPCPYCHRSRSIFTGTESTHSHNLVTFPISQVSPALNMYPDGGHRCPCFPCHICHGNDR